MSQSQIDVYATDAGTVAPLHHIAVVQNAKLSFTRGLVWLEDVHYNANKFGTQGTHTFSWANLGFDGPLLPRDLSYDVNDRLQANSDGTLNLGWSTSPVPSFTINNVTNPQNASGALFMANVYAPSSPVSFTYSVNGHTHTAAWPFPDTTAVSWRAVAFPVPLSDIVAGTNTLSISGSQTIGVANINLVLVGAGGKVAPAAGAPPTATPRPAPATATPTPTRAPQSAATPTPNAASFQLHATANPTSVHRGSAVAFTLSAKSIPSSDVLVDLEVYTSAGTKVFQQFWDNQSFTAGQTRTYSTTWSVPATAAPGSYRVGVGVFSRGWGHTYTWVNTAASVTVQ
jgi:hypothetical protein